MCTNDAVNAISTDDRIGGGSRAVFEVDHDGTVWLVVYYVDALLEMGTF